MVRDQRHHEGDMAASSTTSTCLEVAQILGLIGNKWTILIVDLLRQRPMRFAELRRAIEPISSKMLTTALQRLVRAGLAARTLYPEIPPRVEYCLTPLGHTLAAPTNTLLIWAKAHLSSASSDGDDTLRPGISEAD